MSGNGMDRPCSGTHPEILGAVTRKATDQVTTIGIDIGKNNFHLIGFDGAGNIVLRRKLSRSQVIVRLDVPHLPLEQMRQICKHV